MNLEEHLARGVAAALPADAEHATLIGRLWVPGTGPVLVAVQAGAVHDLSNLALTCSELLQRHEPAAQVRDALQAGSLPRLATLSEVLANSVEAVRDTTKPWLLAPCDLQPIKASGVTFISSLLERVIEEQARGDVARARQLREELHDILGQDLSGIRPGSPEAARVKAVLVQRGAWSQYLEVGIGPDAEFFTKAPVLSAVGTGADIGVLRASGWNNPEPEVVLVVNPHGEVVGATLGNDVNLRDFEGRSALLLGRAKDNNASCAIGPFIRLLDEHFTLDDLRQSDIGLQVNGPDGYAFEGQGSMGTISRDLLDLVGQAMGAHHQYPDGMVLFLGTMLVPTEDRLAPGQGFTHQVGDVVRVNATRLGALVNRVDHAERVAPWTFGLTALMHSLAERRNPKV
jgi:fumarylacetoacetate (FAA) hydrolase family protein